MDSQTRYFPANGLGFRYQPLARALITAGHPRIPQEYFGVGSHDQLMSVFDVADFVGVGISILLGNRPRYRIESSIPHGKLVGTHHEDRVVVGNEHIFKGKSNTLIANRLASGRI